MHTIAPRAGRHDHEPVSTAADPAGQPQKKRRNWWVWISALLAVVAAGLLVWALSIKSDGDSTQQQLDSTEQALASTKQQLDDAQQTPTPTPTPADQGGNAAGIGLAAGAFATMKKLYEDLSADLDAAQGDLANTQEDLQKANDNAAKAEQDAAAAEKKASEASNATDKAKAEADQAKAEADAATSKARVVADCAKAYIASFGSLFEGSDVQAQAPAVREDFGKISAQCKSALAGA